MSDEQRYLCPECGHPVRLMSAARTADPGLARSPRRIPTHGSPQACPASGRRVSRRDLTPAPTPSSVRAERAYYLRLVGDARASVYQDPPDIGTACVALDQLAEALEQELSR